MRQTKVNQTKRGTMNQYILMIALTTSCTPAEVMLVEEVAHEASVAEQAIEADLRGPRKPPGTIYSDQPKTMQMKLVNQRQYPRRGERNYGAGRCGDGGNHGC
jgi:hypothetical protein